MMINSDPSHGTPKPAHPFDVLTAMLVAAFIGVTLIIFGR